MSNNNFTPNPSNAQQRSWLAHFQNLQQQRASLKPLVERYAEIPQDRLTPDQTRAYADAQRSLYQTEYELNRWIDRGMDSPNTADLVRAGREAGEFQRFPLDQNRIGDYAYTNDGQPPRYEPQSLSGQAGQVLTETRDAAVDFVQGSIRGSQYLGEQFYRDNKGNIRVVRE